ncbi:DUF1801 domain-containing protein [Lacinutrix sp. Hel_I_90]|uniref:DUF1801 domain-containing protein n=1 Tax=Lacinutrix sp. Hel_I_90 TaxID=1249999 RepID=UPI0005C99DC6|nr:DUF1801 domain-containing protein [Lacinutrix sp. Hel_I_90]
MKKSENEKVQKFLDEIMLIAAGKADTLIEIREIVFNHFPKTDERIMYGGIVFFLNDEMFSGLFLNKKHISLEFSKGFLMEDPNSFLEGKGKYRRHLKLLTKEDILSKDVSSFVKQAI